MSAYYLSHIGGLEQIVAAELAERLPQARIARPEFGRLHLECPGDPTPLLELRTIENVHVRILHVEGVRPDEGWLDDLEALLARTDLGPAVEIARRFRPIPEPPTFRVTCERHGQHGFRSQEAAGAAGAGIEAAMGWKVDLKGFDVEVLIDIRETQALIGVRLSARALHKRSRVVHPRVTLNPTVAAAMVLLSAPEPGEVVCDPMLGGGTALTERYEHDRDVFLLGGDLFPEKVDLARQNFAALGVPAHLAQWDARWLPLRDESVDKFICNPPWGNLAADTKLNRRMYPVVLAQLRRCLRPGGLMVLITSERRLVQQFANRHDDIRLVRVFRLVVGGLHPSIHVIQRLS